MTKVEILQKYADDNDRDGDTNEWMNKWMNEWMKKVLYTNGKTKLNGIRVSVNILDEH
jgi:beta-glucanase (GH16 family)